MAPASARRPASDHRNQAMTALLAGILVMLALADGACSGFRAVLGRNGRIDHRSDDVRAARVGMIVVTLLLAPAAIVAGLDLTIEPSRVGGYERSAQAMLVVLAPFALVVTLALIVYAVLGWRQKYLAMAVVLGPCTLVRPFVVVGAVAVAVSAGGSAGPVVTALLAGAAVLSVEPVVGRLWCSSRYGAGDQRAA